MSVTALGTAALAFPPLHPALGMAFPAGAVVGPSDVVVCGVVEPGSELTALDVSDVTVEVVVVGAEVVAGETEDEVIVVEGVVEGAEVVGADVVG